MQFVIESVQTYILIEVKNRSSGLVTERDRITIEKAEKIDFSLTYLVGYKVNMQNDTQACLVGSVEDI